jgi:hypothetical protein
MRSVLGARSTQDREKDLLMHGHQNDMLDALARKTVPSRTMTRLVQGVRPFLSLFATAFLVGGVFLPTSTACGDEGIGDPCVPEQEFNEDFNGFDVKEVNVESKSFQCRTRLCLVNHFQGRVSCPYGQNLDGTPKNGSNVPCKVPGTDVNIVGAGDADPRKQKSVASQCVDRAADKTVYCSCRCADINGEKPGDQTFCDCPDGFTCERLVTSIGKGNEGLTGSYCIKNNTKYDPTTACTQGECDALDKNRKCE